MSYPELLQLYEDFVAVLESTNITREEVQAVVEDIQGIVEANNITREDVETIAADLAAIRTEFQAHHPRTGIRR